MRTTLSSRRCWSPFSPLVALAPLVLVLMLAAGCAKAPQGAPTAPIADLAALPQSADAYVDPATAGAPLIPEAVARRLADLYLDEHFSPWHRLDPENGPDKVFAFFATPDPGRFFGETLAPRTGEWMQRMRALSEVELYPNAGLHAITVRGTSMRVAPTDEPLFRDFSQAGEGYPFDYNQNTAVWAQTPVFVSHVSADGAWALCETRYAYGWIPMRDVALVDESFMRAFECGQYVTFTADRVPLHDDFGLYACQGRVGMVLPRIGCEAGREQALLAVRGDMGEAELRTATVSTCEARPFPVAATPANFALLADALMGQPYGWGGMYGHRDCSATLMDLFAAVGVPLPRNSSKQALAGDFVPFDGLGDEDKAALIARRARPWLTLLAKRGHIMLYLGLRDGQPVILHTTWGLKTMRGGVEGRHVIGKTVITTLEPGAELPDLARPDGVLLHKLEGMTFVVPGVEVGVGEASGGLKIGRAHV